MATHHAGSQLDRAFAPNGGHAGGGGGGDETVPISANGGPAGDADAASTKAFGSEAVVVCGYGEVGQGVCEAISLGKY